MPGGAYSALSGMTARLAELDRIAADLANISTPGYKTERAGTAASERESFGDTLDSAVDVVAGAGKIDFSPGVISTTGRDLDLAIDGKAFFVIDTPNGPRYTRNGTFTRRADGILTTADGEAVMGESGEIKLGRGPIVVEADGTVKTGATVAGKLQLAEFEDADLLRETGSRFRAIPGVDPKPSESTVIQGGLEEANVSLVDRMAKLTEVTRGFESLQRGVTTLLTEVDQRAISELTRR